MRKRLKIALAAAAGLLAAVAAAGALFLAMPGTFLTGRTVGAALKRFGASYSPRWSRLEFSARALPGRRHRYVLSAADLCAADPGGAFSACFSELELNVVVRWSRRGPALERVDRLVAAAGGASVDLTRAKPGGAKAGPAALLRGVPVEAFRISFPRFTAVTAKGALSGDFRAGLAAGSPRPLSARLDAVLRSPAGARRLRAELAAGGDLFTGAVPVRVDLEGSAELAPLGRARGVLRLRRAAGGYAISGGAEASAPGGPVRGVRLESCAGSAGAAGSLALSCRYQALAARPGGALDAAKGRLTLSAVRSGQRYRASLEAGLDPVSAWYKVSGKAVVRAAGRLDRPWKESVLSHELSLEAGVPRFQELVAVLRGTKYAVPAPIHVLDGPLTLKLESRGDPRAARATATYAFTSELTGVRQKLRVRAAGRATAVGLSTPARSFEHSGELVLEEAALELPRLDIVRPPKVFVDSRIETAGRRAAPAAFKAPPVRGSLAVKTGKPLILFSNLAKDPVPVALDLNVSFPPAEVSGLVAVKSFGVELFRRSATVDHLNVSLSSGSRVGALEGLVRYSAPGAEILIGLLGTTEKPRVELTSAPPMKREDIIALLIFGKNPDELDPEQTASVGNTETALESRAFGLASLYLFGATPIEHVGYDTATKTTSVKLRLPGGANLTLGSDFDQNRQLTVRKQLAPHWAIQSEVTDQGGESRGAATFLEWFNRY